MRQTVERDFKESSLCYVVFFVNALMFTLDAASGVFARG